MAVVNIVQRDAYFTGFEYYETIPDGATGNDIFIPPLPEGKSITCRIIAGAGTGKFQESTSKDSDVLAGDGSFNDWSAGIKTGTYVDVVMSAISGLRGVSTSGEIKIEVKI